MTPTILEITILSMKNNKKYILVTGATSGIGKAIALSCARYGHYVYGTTRAYDENKLQELNDIIKQEGLKFEWLELDVTNDASIAKLSEALNERPLDVLVNNAGFGVLGPVENYSVEEVQKQMDTNFFGVVRMITKFLPKIAQSQTPQIINISSIAGILSAPAYGIYSASKNALEAYSEALYYEVFHRGIRVSLVEPGGFDTGFSANSIGLNSDELQKQPSWYRNIIKLRSRKVGSDKKVVSSSRDPMRVGELVLAIMNSNSRRLRNFLGSGAYTTYLLRRYLPSSVWQGIMKLVIKRFS